MDDSSNRYYAQENLMADWNRRVLSAVEAQYGPDSSGVRNGRRHAQERTEAAE